MLQILKIFEASRADIGLTIEIILTRGQKSFVSGKNIIFMNLSLLIYEQLNRLLLFAANCDKKWQWKQDFEKHIPGKDPSAVSLQVRKTK